MLTDTLPFSDTLEKLDTQSNLKNRGLGALVRYIEKKLGVSFLIASPSPNGNYETLPDLYALLRKFEMAGIVSSLYTASALPDEPPLYAWIANLYREGGGEANASGAHQNSARAALTATLAESVERYLWFEETDYFNTPTIATTASIADKGEYIDPKSVVGPSYTSRTTTSHLHLDESSVYKWIKGYSWVTKSTIWTPAQLITGNRKEFQERIIRQEPLLHGVSTNGLATRQTREGAVLYGALELIERDAYMIMWLNQLTLPRFNIEDLCSQSPALNDLIATCKKYRLTVDLVRMITDAPTYAVCAVVTDETDHLPKVILGLRAHQNKFLAAEKAILEALRIRQMTRRMLQHPPKDWVEDTKADDVGHVDRVLYWAKGDRWKKLSFLAQGPIERFEEPWEDDSEDEHLERILNWCKAIGYEFSSVSLTKSKKNISPWHVEMVVIPQLQPIHLNEKLRHTGGSRLKEVPKMFGYKAIEPYTDDPHPFA